MKLLRRHISTGVTSSREEAILRANGSDLENAKYVKTKCKIEGLKFIIINNNIK